MLGTAGLVACISVGLFVASAYARRAQAEDEAPGGNSRKAL
jgi:hypothetical protein